MTRPSIDPSLMTAEVSADPSAMDVMPDSPILEIDPSLHRISKNASTSSHHRINVSDQDPEPEQETYLSACHRIDSFLSSSSVRAGNVRWNKMGQVALITGREVIVMTPDTPVISPNMSRKSNNPYAPASSSTAPNSASTSAPPAQHRERPPAPKMKVIIKEESEEVPSVPSEHDLVPCWISRFLIHWPGYESSRRLTRGIESALLDESCAQGRDGALPILIQPRELDVKGIAWSPPGSVRESGGAYIAVLDTSFRVTIRAAVGGDWLRGDYEVVVDLTASSVEPGTGQRVDAGADVDMDMDQAQQENLIQGTLQQRPSRSAIEIALELQSMSIAWSDAPCFENPIGLRPDTSILAIGNRAGGIVLFSVGKNQQLKTLHRSERLTDQFITHMTWGDWRESGQGNRTATLFAACPDGSIFSCDVTRTVSPNTADGIGIIVGKITMVYEGDARPVTGIEFLHDRLVWTKTGFVQILSDEGFVETFQLKKRGNPAGCSAYSPCAGISSLPASGILLSMNSGEQHVIRNVQHDPKLDDSASCEMTNAMVKTFNDVNPDLSSLQFAQRVGGAQLAPSILTGGSTLLAMVHEPFNIIDLSIPLDSERGAYVSLSDLSSVYQPYSSPVDPSEECHPICAASQTPSSVLLSSLPRLKRHLPPMELPLPSSSAASTSTNPFSGFTDRESLQTALEKELVEQDGWLKPRVEYVKAKWTQTENPDDVSAIARADVAALRVDSQILRTIVMWLGGMVDLDPDAASASSAFISRILQAVAKTDLFKTDGTVRETYQDLTIKYNTSAENETCPVCDEEVRMDETEEYYLCGQSHRWGRCALTRSLLETPFVRTCYCCQRRARIPDSQQNSIEQDLLLAATVCPWCGGVWRQVLGGAA